MYNRIKAYEQKGGDNMEFQEQDFRIEDEVDFDAVDALIALQEDLDITHQDDTAEMLAWA